MDVMIQAVPEVRRVSAQSGNPSTGSESAHHVTVRKLLHPCWSFASEHPQISPSLSRNSVPISHPLFERALPTRRHSIRSYPLPSKGNPSLYSLSLTPLSLKVPVIPSHSPRSSDHELQTSHFLSPSISYSSHFSRITLHQTRAAVAYPLRPRQPPFLDSRNQAIDSRWRP
ncbi:uncharacterized protein N7506_002968 [Penicillium brevicompactum]|uniref:uncharacterized protein n=1 Tax=Penicillium brevicompactum TaxID=5074 RepID=UPI002540A063|nr:uncharacterized protein N7506_002968 [Penicillium brevicompactum]KAJ5343144.1 hypothetical protein N7506_002968 [Penicillium brevicompactum]